MYNKINQYGLESYTVDDIRDSEHRSYDMDVDILDYVLVTNNIITPLESQILQYLGQGRGKYEIARIMKTSYYNIKSIVETIAKKIKRFIKENDLEDADNGEMNS
ncbi:MAG: helix-turn-helix transcriptional regulator [Methanobrevibacter sp.]|nr:helix-turn-helix transcriptional regulator [Methanobrevibacter sp.]